MVKALVTKYDSTSIRRPFDGRSTAIKLSFYVESQSNGVRSNQIEVVANP